MLDGLIGHLVGALPSLRWQLDAACAEHPEVEYFPDRGVSVEPARAVCAGCLVRPECLDYALEHNIKHGVWGGLSERERRQVRSTRHAARAA